MPRKRKKAKVVEQTKPKELEWEPKRSVMRIRGEKKPTAPLIESDVLPTMEKTHSINDLGKDRIETIAMPNYELHQKIEEILKQAPRLSYNFDVGYIDGEFREAYINLLRKLVRLYDLPYHVSNVGAFLPK